MSNNKMLIDASHPEETRVVVLRGNRIEEFDFEAANKKPLRGNIYLAKVTRVEPSLQAAFVEYGGNRHGFLAFSEIHPDYYQIPVADRLALLEDEAREQREEAAEEEKRSSRRNSNRKRGGRNVRRSARPDDSVSADASEVTEADETSLPHNATDFDADNSAEIGEDADASAATSDPTSPDTKSSATTDSADEFTVTAGFGPGDEWNNNAEAASGAPTSSSEIAKNSTHTADTPSQPEQEMSGSDQIVDNGQQALAAAHGGSDAQEASAKQPTVQDADVPTSVDAEPAAGQHDQPERLQSRSDEDGEDQNNEDHNDEDNADDDSDEDAVSDEDDVEQFGDDSEEDIQPAPRRSRRQYKIQEVIKRRQIMLIQVVKEERGNKGAALTTYLSLAGRYSVLMPNTARGGGISRKITDGDDRRRMKEIAQELDVPDGMGVILRTAGASRNNQEIRRDFEYLLRLWESVREMTLHSSAPTLVYEEGSLIKRSIRDLYGKEVDEVIVAGDEGYKEARDFMGMLMPSHTRNVKQWRESQPVFAKSGVEPQLDSLFSPNVTLKSGGYIVINQTEALVAIDVNSGRSTREHNIEDTALRTNVEAADEIARQLRLRDLAGLIVVDFIDMEEHRNNRTVERRMKDALKNDRARIQVGRISHFGLLEMSRQRMRTGVLEGSSIICPHCQGSGNIRSTASIALHVLRLTEEALIRNNSFDLTVKTRSEVALYILNQKRATLTELEKRFGVVLTIDAGEHMTGTTYHSIERGEPASAPVAPLNLALNFSSPADDDEETEDNSADQDDLNAGTSADEERSTGRGAYRNRTRGRGRSRRDEETPNDAAPAASQDDTGSVSESDDTAGGAENADSDNDQKRKRRRRRRGRGDRPSSGISAEAPQPSDDGLAFMAGENNGQQGGNGIAAPIANDENADGLDKQPETHASDAGEDAGNETGNTASDEKPRKRTRGGFRRRRRNGTEQDNDEAVGMKPVAGTSSSEGAVDGDEPRAAGAWVKSSAGASPGEPVQTYPFAAPSTSEVTEPVASANDPDAGADTTGTSHIANASANTEQVAASVEVEHGDDSTSPKHDPAFAPVPLSNGSDHAAPPEPVASEPGREIDQAAVEAPAQAIQQEERRPRDIEVLPEAPPPPVKKSGWWKR